MGFLPPSDESVAQIINSVKTIAIVGVSDKPDRPSFQVVKYLIESEGMGVVMNRCLKVDHNLFKIRS